MVFKVEDKNLMCKVNWINKLSKDAARAFTNSMKPGSTHVHPQRGTGKWTPPQGGWMVVNTDACFVSGNEPTGCGGLMRSDEGNWIGGFSCMTKVNHSTKAECWALMQALGMEQGIQKDLVSKRFEGSYRLDKCIS